MTSQTIKTTHNSCTVSRLDDTLRPLCKVRRAGHLAETGAYALIQGWGDQMTDIDTAIDTRAMQAERGSRLRTTMDSLDLDAVLLRYGPNVDYASGLPTPIADSSHIASDPSAVLVIASDPVPHVFSDSGAIPIDIDSDHSHPPLDIAGDDAADRLWDAIRSCLGDARISLGVDELTAALACNLGGLQRHTDLTGAATVMAIARSCKNSHEVACIEKAETINEQAAADIRDLLIPGARHNHVAAEFVSRARALGADGNVIDPIFHPVRPRLNEGPFTPNGEPAFPLPGSDYLLADGDVCWVDTGILVHGYASDFGRTWIVSDDPQPTADQHAQFEQWRGVVERVLEKVGPGTTGAELMEAAGHVHGRRPVLNHFYLIHGIGLESAEMPLIGTDLGPEMDSMMILEPGMVLVLEPVIWSDGSGGYRSEDIVLVTEDGYRKLSGDDYWPFRSAS